MQSELAVTVTMSELTGLHVITSGWSRRVPSGMGVTVKPSGMDALEVVPAIPNVTFVPSTTGGATFARYWGAGVAGTPIALASSKKSDCVSSNVWVDATPSTVASAMSSDGRLTGWFTIDVC